MSGEMKKTGSTHFDSKNNFVVFYEQIVVDGCKIVYDLNLKCNVDQIDYVCSLLQNLKERVK